MARAKVWLEAARPKTLTASLSPVLLGSALAFHDGVFRLWPALLCLAVALSAQVASNFANDYFDYKQGADRAGRLGPARAVASGLIAPRAMLAATVRTLAFTCLCGLLLLFFTGWELLGVGIAVVVFALAYSAGPFPLAYNGLGDLCVLLFFGLVPVCFTYYAQALAFTPLALVLSLGLGFLSVNILVINNYRDYEQDKESRKKTTVVLFGKRFAEAFYLVNQVVALLCVAPLLAKYPWWIPLFAGCAVLFYRTWQEMRSVSGVVLNVTLGRTARNVLLYAAALSALLVCTK